MENTTKASGTDFFRWFHEIEGFGLRSERFYDDILIYMFDGAKDFQAATRMMIKWLESAFEAGVNQQKSSFDKAQD